MADFTIYRITIDVEIAVPTDDAGAAQTFSLANLPGDVRAALDSSLNRMQGKTAAIGRPMVTLSAGTDVTVST